MTRRRKVLAGSAILLVLAGLGGFLALRRLYLPAFHTVREGVLYRSGQPRGPGLEWLDMKGIRTIVNLRNPDREDVEREMSFSAARGIAHHNFALGEDGKDFPEVADRFLALVSDESNWPILVHCSLGHERSGILSALFRIECDGWTPDAALEEARRLGLSDDSQVEAVAFLRRYLNRGQTEIGK